MTQASTRPSSSQVIRTESELRALIGEPAELTRAKVSNRLNAMTRMFIERSPLVGVEERAERYRQRVGFY